MSENSPPSRLGTKLVIGFLVMLLAFACLLGGFEVLVALTYGLGLATGAAVLAGAGMVIGAGIFGWGRFASRYR